MSAYPGREPAPWVRVAPRASEGTGRYLQIAVPDRLGPELVPVLAGVALAGTAVAALALAALAVLLAVAVLAALAEAARNREPRPLPRWDDDEDDWAERDRCE